MKERWIDGRVISTVYTKSNEGKKYRRKTELHYIYKV